MIKACTQCHVEKPLTDFYKKANRSGFCAECKACHYERATRHRKANPERFFLYHKKAGLKSKYGLALEEFNKLKEAQTNCCASCGDAFERMENKCIQVDHCHVTGVVRGILCRNCNLALGYLQDNLTRIHNLASYVEKRM